MLKKDGAYWICVERNCGKTQARDDSEVAVEIRACECGSVMKRETHATVFSYLNFLRETESTETQKKEEGETSCDRSLWTEQPCGERLRWS